MTHTLILLTQAAGAKLERLKEIFAGHAAIHVVATREELEAMTIDDTTTLLSFGSGVIVPVAILKRLRRPAYNMHAASPDFPGRDPHHHAAYRGAKSYGATLHLMTERVDAGPIVAVETFPVAADVRPSELLDRANEAGFDIVRRLGPRLLDARPLPALEGIAWGDKKTSRADLIRMSRISPLVGEAEFERRYRAFDGGEHDNLVVELHGRVFRIDKRQPLSRNTGGEFQEFTEDGFHALIGALKTGGYRFVLYGDSGSDRHVIWRHDVDFSMHRAARLAEIEAAEGIVATYFVNPRCMFYNLLEPEIAALVHRIRDLGHEIGLHFDADAYDVRQWTNETLLPALKRERAFVELLLDEPVRVVSWHNPDQSNLLDFDAGEIGGLINSYSARLRRDYVYCSDSNGYWRFEPMSRVIAAGHPSLHLLTHPAWWTPEPMSPSERIDRAIMGRARRVRGDYDATLARAGRSNVGAPGTKRR